MRKRIKIVCLINEVVFHFIDVLNAANRSSYFNAEFWFCSNKNLDQSIAKNNKHIKYLQNNIWINNKNYLNLNIIKLIRKSDADIFIIHGYSILTNLLAILSCVFFKKKWLFWLERPGVIIPPKIFKNIKLFLKNILIKNLIQQSEGVLGTGKLAIKSYRNIYSQGKYFNFPYSFNLERFLSIRRKRKNKSDKINFLYVGRLIKRKGVVLLIKSFIRLSVLFNNITLNIAGQGDEFNYYNNIIPMRLKNKIIFKGYIHHNQIEKVYQKADVFVIPSHFDGWALVVNEAMASGIPVIATKTVGAAYDLIKNGVNGRLINDNSLFILINSMREYIEKPHMIFKEGQRARREIKSYIPKTMIQKLYTILRPMAIS